MTTTSANAGMPELAINYAATQDNANGEPWPPDGDGYWAIVGRIREHCLTVWRHIGLAVARPRALEGSQK